MNACPNCSEPVLVDARRCPSCGRSLIAGQASGQRQAGGPAGGTEGKAKQVATDLIVHVILGIMYGIVAVVILMFVLRRVIFRNADNPVIWVIVGVIGMGGGVCYGIYKSYSQTLRERERIRRAIAKRDGVAGR